MNFHRSKGGKRNWMYLFTSSENFKKELPEMLLEAGGGMTWTSLRGKHSRRTSLLHLPMLVDGTLFSFFMRDFYDKLYIWYLTASLVQGRRKYRYLLTYVVRRSRKIDYGKERRRGFSFPPSMQITWLNLCSICFSVLCALLSNEIKKLLHC